MSSEIEAMRHAATAARELSALAIASRTDALCQLGRGVVLLYWLHCIIRPYGAAPRRNRFEPPACKFGAGYAAPYAPWPLMIGAAFVAARLAFAAVRMLRPPTISTGLASGLVTR